jgi:peptidoglycan/LPS O-acetylase OafA/YrhL
MASGKLREIERLRGLAALAIVFVHWKFMNPELPPLLRNPETGVDLFFVISGFVVTSSLLRLLPELGGAADFMAAFDLSRPVVRNFYLRRFFRILPAALAVMLLQRLFVDQFPKELGTVPDWTREVACFLAGIYNFALPAGIGDKFSVYWSLSVEEQYYLFIPLLFIALRTRSKRLAACVVVIVLVALVLRPMGDPAIQMSGWYRLFSSQFRFDSLMAGTGLALLWPTTPGAATTPLLPPRLVRFVVVPLALFLILAIPRAAPEYVWHREGFMAAWALSAVLVGYAALDKGYVFAFPVVGRALELLGARSYALYLVHYSMLRIEAGVRGLYPQYDAFLEKPGRSPWVHFGILFAATLVVVELLHQLVEKPFLRVGAAVSKTGSESAVPRVMRWAMVAIAGLMVVFVFRHRLFLLVKPQNLARRPGVTVIASSRGVADCPENDALNNGDLEPEKGFCTEAQSEPWIEIDLGSVQEVSQIYVYNRADGPLDEQVPLEVSLSEDRSEYKNLRTSTRLFTQGLPLSLRYARGTRTRYVHLAVHRSTRITLSEVEVFGR